MSGTRLVVLVVSVTFVLAFPGAASTQMLSSGCAHWAAPTGDDSGPGSESAPFATIGHLLLTLNPGQRGCLAPGAVFDEHVIVSASGRPGAPIILMSTPNRQGGVLQGGVEFAPATHDVTIERVALRTTSLSQLPALVVMRGLRNALIESNLQGAAAAPGNEACVLLDHANHALIAHDVIAQCGHLPASQGYVPGILDSVSTGARIENNVIQQNPSDGISLAPDAQLTVVSRNAIVNNGGGIFFGGGSAYASSKNQVVHNVIAYSATFNIHASYATGAPTGVQNVVAHNCIWHGVQGNVVGMLAGGKGFTPLNNVAAPPTAKQCRENFPSGEASTQPSSPGRSSVPLVSAHGITLTATAAVSPTSVTIVNLSARGVVANATITLKCTKGCALAETLTARSDGAAVSKIFAHRSFADGAVIEATATKQGHIGAWSDFVVQPNIAAKLIFHIQASGCLRGTTRISCPAAGR